MVLKPIEETASSAALQVGSSVRWTLRKRETFNQNGYPNNSNSDWLTCKEIDIGD